MQTLRLVLYGVVLACITICSAEVAARIEDRIRDGTPISSSPSSDSDLKISESSGYNSFDLAALRAVQNAAPFPPLPRAYSHDDLGVNLIVY